MLPPGTPLVTFYTSAAAFLSFAPASPGSPFQCNVTGVTGYNYAIQASTDLINWATIVTNASPFVFLDTNSAALSQRFYRAVYSP